MDWAKYGKNPGDLAHSCNIFGKRKRLKTFGSARLLPSWDATVRQEPHPPEEEKGRKNHQAWLIVLQDLFTSKLRDQMQQFHFQWLRLRVILRGRRKS